MEDVSTQVGESTPTSTGLRPPWPKGTSGNPGGRKKVPEDVKRAFEAGTERAVERLAELMESPDDNIALKATIHWLDRALGRVPDKLKVSHGGKSLAKRFTSEELETLEQLHARARERLESEPH